MIFGKTATQNANGSILAHSLRITGGRIRKGTLLNSDHIKQLIHAGIADVTVAKLEAARSSVFQAVPVLQNSTGWIYSWTV